MKILFYGFRHGHVTALYKKVASSAAFEIVGAIEQDSAAREAAERSLGIVFSDVSYDEWLKTDVDAVAIGTAYGERGAAVIKALRAGKHVISDKPLCTSEEELRTIRALSLEKELKIACMLDLRYLPQTLVAKELLDSGRLGAVRNISVNGQHCIDYAHRPSWYFEDGMHGGTINDLAIHGIDLVRYLTGLEITEVDAARVWNAYAVRHPHFKDSAVFMARLANGAALLADVSYSAPPQVFSMPTYWEFRFWCERGLLTFSYTDNTVTLYEEGVPSPILIETHPSGNDYLREFLIEILRNTSSMTENVLRSTETALYLQSVADKEGL